MRISFVSVIIFFTTILFAHENFWERISKDITPWVTNTSQTNKINSGLQGVHLSIWASHGRYYDFIENKWKWQRPNLFCTTEDIFTPTIVTSYLIPMLEKAGAIVFSPRERDLQTQEIIVDNDINNNSLYIENSGEHPWVTAPQAGFANPKSRYEDKENPFNMGTSRMTLTSKGRKALSYVSYQPNINKAGKYSVYVSYQSIDGSIDDAQYTVYHKGESTTFTVNQQIGGGTWVYLGTFDFDKGCNLFNRVVLSNKSKNKGIVTADAVRFGGGMGTTAILGQTSNLPRALEGARYYAQWAGAPDSVYRTYNGTDHYKEDINVRSLITNWLSGGSFFTPHIKGKGVPIELALGIHSDAGYSLNGKDLIGSLTICTTNHNNGKLGNGISRQISYSLAQDILQNLHNDLSKHFGRWQIRDIYDKNYSETRLPLMPSIIIETLSHQNFPDMVLGQDPNFKFELARSIYKTILKNISYNKGKEFIVTPLQPRMFDIYFIKENKIRLNWEEQIDEIESTAKPTSYKVYTSIGNGGFDNGTITKLNHFEIKLEPNKLYTFKISAINKGGESFTTEELSAYYSSYSVGEILIINGFNRLSSPYVINMTDKQGFDLKKDFGVPFGKETAFVGYQNNFDKTKIGIENTDGLGYSDNSLQGKTITGNEFNYVREHAEIIASLSKYSIVSCSKEAVENNHVNLEKYKVIDFISGLERYDINHTRYYKTFSPVLQRKIREYKIKGGAIFASGAYLLSDMSSFEDKKFMNDIFNVSFLDIQEKPTINFRNKIIELYNEINEKHYAVNYTDIITPSTKNKVIVTYNNNAIAGIINKEIKSAILAFPFECIKNNTDKKNVITAILDDIAN